MELSTKYNIGDKVWFWNNNKKVKAEITKVVVSVEKIKDKVVITNFYTLDNHIWRAERFLFKTKEEL